MTFQWADYLDLAEVLLNHRTTLAQEEACCRASISRAYYAVFCAARNFARDQEGLSLDILERIIKRHYPKYGFWLSNALKFKGRK